MPETTVGKQQYAIRCVSAILSDAGTKTPDGGAERSRRQRWAVGRCRRFWRPDAAVHHLCRSSGQRIYVSARCHTGRAGRTVRCMECRGVLVGTVLSPATSCTPGGGTGQRKVMAAGNVFTGRGISFSLQTATSAGHRGSATGSGDGRAVVAGGGDRLAGHCTGGITESGGCSLASASGDGIDSFSPENGGRRGGESAPRIAGDGSRNSTFAPGKHCAA